MDMDDDDNKRRIKNTLKYIDRLDKKDQLSDSDIKLRDKYQKSLQEYKNKARNELNDLVKDSLSIRDKVKSYTEK